MIAIFSWSAPASWNPSKNRSTKFSLPDLYRFQQTKLAKDWFTFLGTHFTSREIHLGRYNSIKFDCFVCTKFKQRFPLNLILCDLKLGGGDNCQQFLSRICPYHWPKFYLTQKWLLILCFRICSRLLSPISDHEKFIWEDNIQLNLRFSLKLIPPALKWMVGKNLEQFLFWFCPRQSA